MVDGICMDASPRSIDNNAQAYAVRINVEQCKFPARTRTMAAG